MASGRRCADTFGNIGDSLYCGTIVCLHRAKEVSLNEEEYPDQTDCGTELQIDRGPDVCAGKYHRTANERDAYQKAKCYEPPAYGRVLSQCILGSKR
jgi:hypothetical protein